MLLSTSMVVEVHPAMPTARLMIESSEEGSRSVTSALSLAASVVEIEHACLGLRKVAVKGEVEGILGTKGSRAARPGKAGSYSPILLQSAF